MLRRRYSAGHGGGGGGGAVAFIQVGLFEISDDAQPNHLVPRFCRESKHVMIFGTVPDLEPQRRDSHCQFGSGAIGTSTPIQALDSGY
jgi:hypothetical protein